MQMFSFSINIFNFSVISLNSCYNAALGAVFYLYNLSIDSVGYFVTLYFEILYLFILFDYVVGLLCRSDVNIKFSRFHVPRPPFFRKGHDLHAPPIEAITISDNVGIM